MKYQIVLKYILGFIIVLCYANISEGQSVEFRPQAKETDQFSSNILNKRSLAAFEQRGIQKMRDFIDYVELIRGEEYNEELKKYAVQSALNLFLNESKTIYLPYVASKRNITVKTFLEVNAKQDAVFYIQNISSQEPFLKVGNSYIGKLKFEFGADAYEKRLATVEVIVTKVNKKFGNESQMIWEVKLGNIDTLP